MASRRALASVALALVAQAANAVMVTFDPGTFQGTYVVQGTTLGSGSGIRSADLAPGNYGVDIGAVGSCSRKVVTVNADGTVSNPATSDSTGALSFTGATVRFRNAPLGIDPGAFTGQVWTQLSGVATAPFLMAGPHTLTVVPDTVYRLRIERSSSFTHFVVDRDGNALHPASLPAACSTAAAVPSANSLTVSGNTVHLRTAPVRIDPRAYAGRYSIGPLQNAGPTSGVRDVTLVAGMEAQVKLASLDALGFLSFAVQPDGSLVHYSPPGLGNSTNRVDLDNGATPPAVRFRNATVLFDPDRYSGLYRFDFSTVASSFSGPNSVVLVPDMAYEMRIGANTAPLNRIGYRVDATGNVGGFTDGGLIDGALVFEAVGATARFVNVRLFVGPRDASAWRVTDVTPNQASGITGPLRFYAVPRITFQLFDFDANAFATFQVAEPCTLTPTGGVSVGASGYDITCVPQAEAGIDLTVDEGAAVQLDGTSSDFPGPTRNYTWTQVGGPPVALTGATSATPQFVAPPVSPADGSQVLTFQLVVDDGLASSDPDTVDVTVKHLNRAPVADAGDDVSVREGAPVQLSGAASFDPDGDALTHAWTQTGGPTVALQPNAFVANPTFQAPLGSPTLTFQLRVSDGRLGSEASPGTDPAAADTVRVVVGSNTAPIADAGADQATDEGATVQLVGSGRDPDSDAFTLQWSQASGPAVTLSDASAAAPSFTAPAVGVGGVEIAFQLVATDAYGFNPLASAPDFVTVRVRNVGEPPRCDAAQPGVAKLWPPDHKMREVTVAGLPAGAEVTVTGVTQDEPVNGLGDGDSAPDAVLQGDRVLLRAERSGKGNGRVYTIQFTATLAGLSCAGSVKAAVPKDRNGEAVDDGQAFASTQP